MSTFFAIIGEGPNGLEIPLVICQTKDEADAIVEQLPWHPTVKGCLDDNFVERRPPYVDEDYEETKEGERLYSLIFKDGNYYDGCGGCYSVVVREYEFGQAMVAWDLD